MKNNLDEILNAWFDKYGKNGSVYPDERIAEIATNCVSLTNVWLNKIEKLNVPSFEIKLFNKDGVMAETLYGVSKDNLSYAMLDILANSSQIYSKMEITYFMFDGSTKISKLIGELEIS